MLETGYPRDDVLARAGPRRARARELRRRLGIPEGARVVLYAPTYRDHVRGPRAAATGSTCSSTSSGSRDALGDDTVILFRKHHYIVDPVPGDRGRLRARRLDLPRRRPSCCSPPTCSSPTTPR